jgi:hypothetical protein
MRTGARDRRMKRHQLCRFVLRMFFGCIKGGRVLWGWGLLGIRSPERTLESRADAKASRVSGVTTRTADGGLAEHPWAVGTDPVGRASRVSGVTTSASNRCRPSFGCYQLSKRQGSPPERQLERSCYRCSGEGTAERQAVGLLRVSVGTLERFPLGVRDRTG